MGGGVRRVGAGFPEEISLPVSGSMIGIALLTTGCMGAACGGATKGGMKCGPGINGGGPGYCIGR